MSYARNSKGKVFDKIQEAINDLQADGGWVEVSTGTFTEDITLRHQGITLRGQGYNTFIGHVDFTRPATILICGAANAFVIRDIRIWNPSSGTAILVSGASTGLFDNVAIVEAGRDGIELIESTSTKINNCTISDFLRHAVSIMNSCGVLLVKNVLSLENISGSMINISGGGGHVISDNFLIAANNSGVGVSVGAGVNGTTIGFNRIAGFGIGIDDNGVNTLWSGFNNIS